MLGYQCQKTFMGYIYIFFKLSSLYFIFTFLSMTNFCLKKGSWDKSLVLSLLWDLSLGFVIYGRGLSYVGGIFTCGALSYVGGICQIWGQGLSYMGGICHMWGGLSYMGGVCHIWAGFVTLWGLSFFWRDLSNMGGICHGICHKKWWQTPKSAHMWQIPPKKWQTQKGDKSRPYLTNPTHIWQTPPHMTNPTQIWQTPLHTYEKSHQHMNKPHIWQIPPTYDKPHLVINKSWKRQ